MTKGEFYEKSQSGELKWERRSATEETVDPNDIIVDRDWNTETPQFWNHHGRDKDDYLEYVSSGQADSREPPEVYKCEDKYVLVDDGNHRVAASQELNRPMKVKVTGEYVDQNQEQNDNEADEEEISM